MENNYLLGTKVTNASEEEILEYIFSSLQKKNEKYYIVTPNPEIVVFASQTPSFNALLHNARLALCDGVGLVWAGRILGTPFKSRVTGTDLLQKLCEESAKKPITIGFLGGRPGVALKASECLKKRFPGLQVVMAESGNPDEKTAFLVKEKVASYRNQEQNAMGLDKKEQEGKQEGRRRQEESTTPTSLIHSDTEKETSRPLDLLFVAFGFPKQEQWMAQYLDTLPVRVAMGVGGAFDYISGDIVRAPSFVRSLGLEWLFRLLRQPWRITRQVALLQFIWLVVKEKLR